MANITRGYTFGATETVTNTKLHLLIESATISNILNADIGASAAIAESKLADIISANKVGGTALGNLASIPSGSGLIPYANIPQTSLTSIPNSDLLPLTQASWVDGIAMRNLASIPSSAGVFNYNIIVSSLASGGIPRYNGQNKFVGSREAVAELGDVLQSSADTERTENGSSYVKVKEIIVPRGGSYRLKWRMHRTASATAFGRVYRNGIAVGTEKSSTSDSYEQISDDVSGWSPGDLCQLYIKTSSGPNACYIDNFRIYENIGVDYTVNTD